MWERDRRNGKKTQPKASHALTLLAWLGMEIYLIRYTNENGLASYAIVYCKMIALRVRSVVWTDIWCYMHAIGLGKKWLIVCARLPFVVYVLEDWARAVCTRSLFLSFLPSSCVFVCIRGFFFIMSLFIWYQWFSRIGHFSALTQKLKRIARLYP